MVLGGIPFYLDKIEGGMSILQNINGGTATKILSELQECGFIRNYNSIGKKAKGSLFQLIDMFSLFHHQFLQNKNIKDENEWIKMIDHPQYRAWSGYAFEMVGLHHTAEIKAALGIEGILTHTNAWKSKTAQIDLVLDRRDQVINLIEMKYSTRPYKITKKYGDELLHKIAAFKEETKSKKAIHLILLTTMV